MFVQSKLYAASCVSISRYNYRYRIFFITSFRMRSSSFFIYSPHQSPVNCTPRETSVIYDYMLAKAKLDFSFFDRRKIGSVMGECTSNRVGNYEYYQYLYRYETSKGFLEYRYQYDDFRNSVTEYRLPISMIKRWAGTALLFIR